MTGNTLDAFSLDRAVDRIDRSAARTPRSSLVGNRRFLAAYLDRLTRTGGDRSPNTSR